MANNSVGYCVYTLYCTPRCTTSQHPVAPRRHTMHSQLQSPDPEQDCRCPQNPNPKPKTPRKTARAQTLNETADAPEAQTPKAENPNPDPQHMAPHSTIERGAIPKRYGTGVILYGTVDYTWYCIMLCCISMMITFV